MEMTLQWYFSVGILGFCAVAMAMRLGARARRRTDRRAQGRVGRPGNLAQWLAARFAKGADNWYCFFKISDLTGENRPAPSRPDNRRRAAPRSRLRAAAPPRP
jgi:hypothetical protein